ncbi:hypothetical protein BS50DRAFT_582280 [Corynespora cassiicola Philippines]|uniref:Uncharacterized protein n=1 Tax=Corynespora cassiicola Philippines TaxID=1448308 RepID=A0A2T2PD83_CORCC|nr:hypothetical protein BS50DRAFT_582280 [Corynespora cassiicola Philippines]
MSHVMFSATNAKATPASRSQPSSPASSHISMDLADASEPDKLDPKSRKKAREMAIKEKAKQKHLLAAHKVKTQPGKATLTSNIQAYPIATPVVTTQLDPSSASASHANKSTDPALSFSTTRKDSDYDAAADIVANMRTAPVITQSCPAPTPLDIFVNMELDPQKALARRQQGPLLCITRLVFCGPEQDRAWSEKVLQAGRRRWAKHKTAQEADTGLSFEDHVRGKLTASVIQHGEAKDVGQGEVDAGTATAEGLEDFVRGRLCSSMTAPATRSLEDYVRAKLSASSAPSVTGSVSGKDELDAGTDKLKALLHIGAPELSPPLSPSYSSTSDVLAYDSAIVRVVGSTPDSVSESGSGSGSGISTPASSLHGEDSRELC